MMLALPTDTRFGTAIIDPPWPNGRRSGTGPRERSSVSRMRTGHTYTTLTPSEILNLPINRAMAPNAVILLWVPAMYMRLAILTIAEWRFQYATMFPWVKTRTTHPDPGSFDDTSSVPAAVASDVRKRLIYGPGVWAQQCAEYVIVARRGQPFGSSGNPRPARKGIIVAPRQEHSRKPDDLHLWVETAQPPFPGPYLELFARRRRQGWICVGDQMA